MKTTRYSFLVLAILALLTSSCNGTPQEPVEPMPSEPPQLEQKCIDFLGFPDDATFGPAFVLEGVRFTMLGTRDLSVNDVASGVHGLVFDEGGIQTDLPGPSSVITLTAGAWYPEPLEITALDSTGTSIDQAMVTADNSLHTHSLAGADITSIVITGGGGEGVLVDLCIEVEPAPPSDESCLDFHGFPDNATLGPAFLLQGVRFSKLGTRDLFVNDATPSVHGLAFDEVGLQIELPGPAAEVSLSAGAWYPEGLQITAMDGTGNAVDGGAVTADNSLHDVSLVGPDIASITIIGGGGEGVLVEICWTGN